MPLKYINHEYRGFAVCKINTKKIYILLLFKLQSKMFKNLFFMMKKKENSFFKTELMVMANMNETFGYNMHSYAKKRKNY